MRVCSALDSLPHCLASSTALARFPRPPCSMTTSTLHPVLLAFLGTLFTYGMTAVGAACVFLVPRSIAYKTQRKVLDAALGFAAGVMIAASCFGLLNPAFDFAKESGTYGAHTWIPAVVGVLLGGAFVHATDVMIPHEQGDAVAVLTGTAANEQIDQDDLESGPDDTEQPSSQKPQIMSASTGTEPASGEHPSIDSPPQTVKVHIPDSTCAAQGIEQTIGISPSQTGVISDLEMSALKEEGKQSESVDVASKRVTRKTVGSPPPAVRHDTIVQDEHGQTAHDRAQSWRRILLLVIAIVVHNFPEGLAVGVGFGALETIDRPPPASNSAADIAIADAEYDKEYSRVFNDARTLAIGIGLQNFPEGLAVSLPLMRVGYSPLRAFCWGQLSGMVEPLGGVLGGAVVAYIKPILPYALSFAAGAMIFVVAHDILPETRAKGGYPMLAVWFLMIGFSLMMVTQHTTLGGHNAVDRSACSLVLSSCCSSTVHGRCPRLIWCQRSPPRCRERRLTPSAHARIKRNHSDTCLDNS